MFAALQRVSDERFVGVRGRGDDDADDSRIAPDLSRGVVGGKRRRSTLQMIVVD